MNYRKKLTEIYENLFSFFGSQKWWPGKSAFEIMVGAVLTQNTNWQNVERAIKNLKKAKALTPDKIISMSEKELAELIRPSGYFNLKAKRLKSFVHWYKNECKGRISNFKKIPDEELRVKLVNVYGIGEETADSMMLYAGNKTTFVIDAYTKRIFSRIGLCKANIKYGKLRDFFMSNLPKDSVLFNEYHALLVALGKDYCRPKRPNCSTCPLETICPKKGLSKTE